MSEIKDVPVFLFTGFLESGKTKFIQETLEDKRFNSGERTLLIVCEEGEEEYAPDQFAGKNVFIKVVEEPEELNRPNLRKWLEETDSERVVIEYNGMWMLDDLYQALPEMWMVYQEFLFADARTFVSYNANMRNLVYDKLKSAELVVFNRYDDSIDRMTLHKIVRGASRRSDIAYEYADGNVQYDDIEDPLPFDVNAPIIEIGDDDYAIWYRDLSEEPQKYENKTVRFKCRYLKRKKVPEGSFIVGRHVMTCCAEDIQFAGLICKWDGWESITGDSWHILTARINHKFSRAYGKKGPVLTYISDEPCEVPENPVASF
ncbi:MAG: outer membrane insertion C- signal [Firmicutes bacterium]|nr:outer membrane insertion C- signal [Bacillota bacterium]